MYQDSVSKHWCPAVIESVCPEPRSYKKTTNTVLFTGKHKLTWNLLHLRIRTCSLTNVCHHQWCSLPTCGQWKLSSRRSHKWAIKFKYRQEDLKGTLSPQSGLIFKYFKMFTKWIFEYIQCIIAFTGVCMCICKLPKVVRVHVWSLILPYL